VKEIEALGGRAVADETDVSDWAGAEQIRGNLPDMGIVERY
jgi:hypothetical protein